jgi:hypothetical protein
MDVNLEELDQIIERGTHAPLSESESEKLKSALHALAGMLPPPRSTEKTKDVLGQPTTPAPKSDLGPVKGHGRNSASSYTGAQRVMVAHPTMKPGDACPGCEKGKVYPQKEPRALVRVVGQAPLAATVYELDRLRCNLCGEVFTAQEPEGIGPEKYRPSVAADLEQTEVEQSGPCQLSFCLSFGLRGRLCVPRIPYSWSGSCCGRQSLQSTLTRESNPGLADRWQVQIKTGVHSGGFTERSDGELYRLGSFRLRVVRSGGAAHRLRALLPLVPVRVAGSAEAPVGSHSNSLSFHPSTCCFHSFHSAQSSEVQHEETRTAFNTWAKIRASVRSRSSTCFSHSCCI